MRRTGFIPGAMLFLASIVAPAAAATILADARGNYQAATNGSTTASFNSGTGLSDTFGTGRWNYYESDNPNLNATANEALLDFGTPGSPVTPGYGGGGQAGGFDLPAVADSKLFSTSETLLPNQLATHPDDGSGVGSWVVIRWTAGVGEAGLLNIAGMARNHLDGTNVNGTDFRILYNGGTTLHSAIIGATPSGTAETSYNLFKLISVGDTIDFAIGNNGGYFNDSTHFSAVISVPEPSSLGLLLVGGALLGKQHLRRRQKSVR